MNDVPAGTFRFEVVGAPTTDDDLKVITWAFGISYHMNCMDAEMVDAMRHNLPYEQGGGLVKITRTSAADAQAEARHQYAYSDEDWGRPWGNRTEECNKLGIYTGWVLEDHYTDSMTHPYWSPIFVDNQPIHEPYITWEM